jgi:glycosyltransferase involved in cell wall biosynthesis
MAVQKTKVIHIDTELGWRGGQQQVIYLHKSLCDKGFHSNLICNPNSALHQKCIESNLPVTPIRMRGEVDFFSALKVSRLVKSEKVDIVQCHSGHAQSIGILSKLFYKQVKLITVRRVDFNIKKNLLSRIKYTTNLIDKIVCVSHNIKNVLIQDGIPEEKLEVIHSGVDLNRFKFPNKSSNIRKEYNLGDDDILIGTVAAFVGHKDYNNLIHSAKIVLQSFPRVTFIAVGDGNELKQMKELTKQLVIEDNFIFTGYREDVLDLLHSFDIFVLASKKEGLGTSVLDAQAAGLPIVATNAGGIPEMIENGVNGLLVEKQNSGALANGILKLISDADLIKKISSGAKISVEKFDIRNTMNKNLILYRKLIDELE